MSGKIPAAPISSGGDKSIPLVGLGTAVYPFGGSPETVRDAILDAIKLGYRHLDTAALYQSEPPVGEAISEALRQGIVKSRDELFITTKIWGTDCHRDLVLPALKKSLKNLQLDYVDLYLIHWPVSLKPGEIVTPVKKEDVVPLDFKSVWEAMEECQELGLTKSIGVSNFSCKKLEIVLATAKIPPAVNQVEMHPMRHQKKLREFCGEKGIHISAYSPLGGYGTPWGSNLVLESDVLKQIADAHGKSVAQVCLRWGIEQGASVIVKSFNKERLALNLDIFDWKLSPEDLRKISEFPQFRIATGAEYISEEGPYKSLEELWDGDD